MGGANLGIDWFIGAGGVGGAQCILKLWGGGLAPAATSPFPTPTPSPVPMPMESKSCQTWTVYFNWEGGEFFYLFYPLAPDQ